MAKEKEVLHEVDGQLVFRRSQQWEELIAPVPIWIQSLGVLLSVKFGWILVYPPFPDPRKANPLFLFTSFSSCIWYAIARTQKKVQALAEAVKNESIARSGTLH